jgi:hypothetical protein
VHQQFALIGGQRIEIGRRRGEQSDADFARRHGVSVKTKHLPRGVAAFLINAENNVACFGGARPRPADTVASSASDPVRRR